MKTQNLALLLVAVLLLQGCAGSPTHTSAAAQASQNHCVQSTGSLIPAKPGRCLPGNGRSYSRDEIRRTGATTTSDALRQLDPSIY